MAIIHLTTFISAPIERVFDLSRSMDLHKRSMSHTREEAIGGITSGLIEMDQFVTWKARHLGKTRILKTKITAMNKPHMFIDEQVVGDLKKLRHEHHFKSVNNGTIMIDLFKFITPFGKAGQLFNRYYLKKYLSKLLEKRNSVIKEFAESEKWTFILNK
jgi:ligand-binding SRPBCC domain-containing protein